MRPPSARRSSGSTCPFARRGPAPEVYLKLESLQPIGSFKIRGAWNAVRQLTPHQMRDGVWTVSAGNAAQGVAFAARRAGVPLLGDGDGHGARDQAACHRRRSAPPSSRPPTTSAGPPSSRTTRPACAATSCIRSTTIDFIAGNGTAGLEILEDLPDVDAVVAALGGGGLLAGIGAVMRARKPGVRVYAAEPETAAPLSHVAARAAKRAHFDGWTPIVRRRRRRQVGAARRCGRCCKTLVSRLDRDAAR